MSTVRQFRVLYRHFLFRLMDVGIAVAVGAGRLERAAWAIRGAAGVRERAALLGARSRPGMRLCAEGASERSGRRSAF